MVRAYHGFVWQTALRVTRHPEDAADVCQDVFLDLMLKPPPDRVASERGFLAWSVIGRAGRLRRAAQRRRSRELEAAKRAGENGLPWDDSDNIGALHAAVDHLPEDLRTVVELHYLAGLPNREIAETLGVSERTVGDRLHRGREILRRRLAPAALAPVFLAGEAGCVPPPPELLPQLLRLVRLGAAMTPRPAGALAGALVAKRILTARAAVAVLVAVTVTTTGILLISGWVRPGEGRAPAMPGSRQGAASQPVTDPDVPGGGQAKGRPEPQTMNIKGRAVFSRSRDPIPRGTILARRAGAETEPSSATIAADGTFSFEWVSRDDPLELTVQSDDFPPPAWVGISMKDDAKAGTVDIGDVPFDIPENVVWGLLTGEVPQAIRARLRPIAHPPRTILGDRTGRSWSLSLRRAKLYQWCDLPADTDAFVELMWARPGEVPRPIILRTDTFRVPEKGFVRQDVRFAPGPLSGRLLLPWVFRPGLLDAGWPPFQDIDSDVALPDGINRGKGQVHPRISLTSRTLPGVEITSDVVGQKESNRASFDFSPLPIGRYLLEVVFFEDPRVGRDVVYTTEIEVPYEGPPIEIDLRHLRSVKVEIHDPLFDAEDPLHAGWTEGLCGKIFHTCTPVLYTLECKESGGETRCLGVTRYRALWGRLFLAPGSWTIQVSRAFPWRVKKLEHSVPEVCGGAMAFAGVDDEVDVHLERPRWFQFEDGQGFRLDQAVGEVSVHHTDEEGSPWEITMTENQILERDGTGRLWEVIYIGPGMRIEERPVDGPAEPKGAR